MHVRYLQHQHQGTVQLLLMPLSTANSVKSHKWASEDEESECDAVPLPIQTFLWRQTNPFLGAKIGKLHEASCVTFERVVVQNILHGLSPSLSDAIGSVSRWKFVRAAYPHVIQCCGSLLEAHSLTPSASRGLPPSLSKILYILHWMLLDSATECMETASSNTEDQSVILRKQALFSISSIQLFVYLIAPLSDTIKEEDISSNIRLESGLKIWQALWQFRQPDILCFCAPVKQRKDELPHLTFVKRQIRETPTNAKGIYLGDEPENPRRPSIVPPPKPPRTDAAVLYEKKKREQEKEGGTERKETLRESMPDRSKLLIDVGGPSSSMIPPPKPPVGVARKPIVDRNPTAIVRSVSEYKTEGEAMETRRQITKSHTANAFDVSPTSENSLRILEEVESALRFVEDNSLSLIFSDQAPLVELSDICSGISLELQDFSQPGQCEVICETCGRVLYREGTVVSSCKCSKGTNGTKLKVVKKEETPTPKTEISRDETLSSCSQQTVVHNVPTTTKTEQSGISIQRDLSSEDIIGSPEESEDSLILPDPTIASFLDVAVIRSLLIRHWSEDGVYWAMRYLLNRLSDIQTFITDEQSKGRRGRSNSLPIARKHTQQMDPCYFNPTWADMQLECEEEKGKLHVAFKDNSRRVSSDQGTSSTLKICGHQSRRSSLNTMGKRERNRSDPSLNSSLEVLSIRDDNTSTANLTEKEKGKRSEKLAAIYHPEALGSTNFIEKDGTISYTVIVQTINAVMERSSAVRLCELALSIADILLRTPADRDTLFFNQLTGMAFRIYLSLGCPHGCNEGVKSAQGDFLRGKAKTIIATLERLDEERFKKLLTDYVEANPPQQILDLVHSITAFCRSEFPVCSDGRRTSESRTASYRNHFNEKEKGIEGRIVNATFKTLCSKLTEYGQSLIQPENMSLYQDVRMFVNFIQEHHGNPFRRVGLSALLDAIPKLNKKNISSSDTSRSLQISVPHISLNQSFESDTTQRDKSEDNSGKSSPSGLTPNAARGDHASLRRGLFKKKDKNSGADESEADSSPSTPHTMSSVDESVTVLPSTLKKKSAPKLHFAFNLLKTVRSENNEEECSDTETVCEESEADGESTKKGGEKKTQRQMDRSSLSLWGVTVPPSKFIDIRGISSGARRFAFLLETSKPGTFPDSPLIGAILHLKSPVVSRATILIECAHFVSRCNRGDWPEWIRSSHARTFSLGGPLANRGTPSATRRMHSLQRTAGRHFYQWALQIGEQLNRMLDKTELKDKRELKMEDVMEDFLDDSLVNDSTGERCPMALQLVSVLLLQEITAFLRETFRTIPRGKTTKSIPSSGWDKLINHRRWSILSNTFNPQQTGSISSIADAIAPGLHLSERERRISLSTAEEDSPRGSKDTIEQELEKKDDLSRRTHFSARPPSLSVRLFSRQSTHDDSASSTHGSTRSTNYNPSTSDSDHLGRRLATGRQRLLKRGSPSGTQPTLESSHKRRQQASFRIRKQSKPPTDEIEKDPESQDRLSRPSLAFAGLRAALQQTIPDVAGALLHEVLPAATVSTTSGSAKEVTLRPTHEDVPPSPSEHQPPVPLPSHPSSQQGSGVYQTREKANAHDDEEDHMINSMPWIKVICKMLLQFDMDCTHEPVCSVNCFQRISRQSNRLIEAVSFIYGDKKETTERIDRRRQMYDKWTNEQHTIRRQFASGDSPGTPSPLSGSVQGSHGGSEKSRLPANLRKSLRMKAHKSLHSRQSAVIPRRESALTGPHGERSSMAIKALLMEKMMQEKAEKEKEKEKDKDKEDTISKKISMEQDKLSEESDGTPDTEANLIILGYIKNNALGLVHSPLSLTLKSCLLMTTDNYKQLAKVGWKLLLNEDPHVVLSAASLFIVASVRRSEDTLQIITSAIESDDANERSGAVQRFYALWRNRFHVWLKMEDGAQSVFKVPPPGIDFTLPSPPIGQSQLPVVDPPWMPHLKTKVEELSLKEEEHATSQTIMTMTRTRRKQKQEMVKRAVREAEERQCEQRQAYRLRGSAIVQQAAYEPALFHHQESSEETETGHSHTTRHVMPVAQPLFPSVLLSVVPSIIDLVDDPQVDRNGVSVGDVSKKVIWTCIVEDPSLFFRHFLEKLTNRERQEHLLSILRKLILRFQPFPSQAAYSLLNYLFGFVMHYVRAACEGGDKALGMALSLTWLLAPHVNGLYFKDLKQTLKKEQCDQALMITANVPSAKKIIIHGPDSGWGGIPSQFPVHEDTQFQQILSDSLEFFNIEEDTQCYFLTDAKTGTIHMPSSYVRDFYFFHRSFYPQLSLVKLDLDEAMDRMRASAFSQRFIDVGKVLLTHNILQHSPQNVMAQRIFFLHDELTHLPSFPRKSLESSFGLYTGRMGAQLKAIDAMHKFVWAKLMSDMFEKMENAFMFADLHLFINVVNGIMIMHCEDILILRRCAATYIAISIHFNSLFASQGFFLIMPTLLRCYSQRQTNPIFCGVVEFICRQFYTLHRKPFVLQMCGSIANILDNNNNDFEINPMRVKSKYWFNLLKAMENMSDESDPFDILGLVPYPQPLKALDLCYRDDPNTFCILTDAIASCICVCAFSPEGKRSHHMLLVMHSLLPHLIQRAEESTFEQRNSPQAVKAELQMYTTMAVEMKALIHSCETLQRGPQRTFDIVNTVSERGKSFIADSPQFFDPPTTNEEDTKAYHIKEKKSTAVGWEAADVEEQQKESYRRPRDTLLCLAATFIEMATPRLKELSKLCLASEHTKIPEVMDHKCHVKLSEVALALLKIAPYDLNTMSCIGLQKYFLHVLPVTDWSIESNRSALNIVLRRLDKTIAKIAKKQSIRRRVNWPALSNWLIGLCDTLSAFPYIAHLHPLKTTTQMCLRIMVGDPCNEEGTVSSLHPTTVLHSNLPPQGFCQATLRLTTILMQALGQFAFSLEFVCSNDGIGVSADRLEAILCHVLIPLFLKAATPTKESTTVFQSKDLLFCLNMMQNAISPPIGKQSVAPLVSTSTLATSFIRGQTHDLTGRQGSVSVTDRGHSATVSTNRLIRDSVCQSIFLALKVMMLSFGKLLSTVWPKVARLVKDLINKKAVSQSTIAFVDFLLQSNLPIALLILPIIQNKLKQKPVCEGESTFLSELSHKLSLSKCNILPLPVLLNKCAHELSQLKEEFATKPIEMPRSYTPTMADPHSDSSSASLAPHKTPLKPSMDRRASSGIGKTRTKDSSEQVSAGGPSTILEDVEDENAEPSTSTAKVNKSPSVPLNKTSASPRVRSMSGFGMWRSVRRKSRNVSTESEGESERSVEMADMRWKHPVEVAMKQSVCIGSSSQQLHSPTSPPPASSSTMGEPHEQRHRFVSFSTPKSFRKEEDFHIVEQHHLV